MDNFNNARERGGGREREKKIFKILTTKNTIFIHYPWRVISIFAYANY